jgi:hypothetical protein
VYGSIGEKDGSFSVLQAHKIKQLLHVSLKKLPNKEKIEFLHIPKTGALLVPFQWVCMDRLPFAHSFFYKKGGTAVEHAGARQNITWGACHFYNMSLNPTIFPGCRVDFPNLDHGCIGDNGFNNNGYNSCWHLPPGTLETMIGKTPYDNSSLFAVVRNPYTRLISELYCHWSGYQGDKFTPKTFDAFARERIELHRMGEGRDHDIPQSHFIFRNVSSMKRDDMPDQMVDHVLFFEDFSNQFHSLMKEYNLTVKLQKRKVNAGTYNSTSKLGIGDLSPTTIAMVNELYKDDFCYLGYVMVSPIDLKEGWADEYDARSIFMHK